MLVCCYTGSFDMSPRGAWDRVSAGVVLNRWTSRPLRPLSRSLLEPSQSLPAASRSLPGAFWSLLEPPGASWSFPGASWSFPGASWSFPGSSKINIFTNLFAALLDSFVPCPRLLRIRPGGMREAIRRPTGDGVLDRVDPGPSGSFQSRFSKAQVPESERLSSPS